MATPRTISVRLAVDDAVAFRQQLEDAGVQGGTAVDKIRTSLEKLNRTDPSAVVAAMKRISDAAVQAQTAAGQAQANAFAGVTLASSADDYAARGADIAAYGAELDRLRAKYDPLFAVSKKYSDQVEEIGLLERNGVLNKQQAALALTTLTKNYSDASDKANGLTAATNTGTSATNAGAAAHGAFSLATAGSTRELIVLGHEALTGNFSRIPGSLLVLAERAGGLHTILGGVGDVLTSTAGIFGIVGVAGVATLGVLAYNAESTAARISDLSARLRVTKTDYDALAVASTAAAKAATVGTGISTADSRTAYQTFAAIPNYSATSDQLTALIKLSGDVARSFGTDVPKAAEQLAVGLQNPTAAAKKLVDEGFTGMDAGLERVIERMQNSGHVAEAQAAILTAYQSTLGGVSTKGVTPLRQALNDLSATFSTAGTNGKSFGEEIGGFVLDSLTSFIRDVETMTRGLQKLRDVAGSALTSTPLVDANTGQAVNASADLQRTHPEVTNKVYSIAEANGIDASIADLGTRIAYQESRGNQTNASGGILTSSAGAQGVFQLLPSTAADKSINPTGTLNPLNIDDNILLGLRYLANLSKDPRFTSEADVSGAYNAGPGAYAQVLNGTRPISNETAGYVRAITGAPAPPVFSTQAPAATTGPSGLPDSVKAALGSGGDGTVAETAQNADDKISKLVLAIGDLDAAGQKTGPTMDRLTALLAKARGEYTNAISPVDALTRAANDQLGPLQALQGAQRTVAEALNSQALAARSAGTEVSDVQANELRTATLAKLAAAFADTVTATDLQTAATQRTVDGLDSSAASFIAAQNREKALAAARNDFLPGAAQDAAVDQYTAALQRQTAAAADLASAQKSFTQRDQLDVLALETTSLGQNEDLRSKEIALLQEKQALLKAGADLSSAQSQADLANVAAIADATAQLTSQKNSLSELSGFFTSTFDTISTAITSAFAVGSKSAVDFGSITKGVVTAIESEFLKLALLNPLKNALFGSSDPTLGSVGGVLGNALGGSSAVETTAVAAGSAAALLGQDAGIGGGLVLNSDGNSVAPSDLTAAEQAKVSGGSGISLTQGLGVLGAGSKLLGGSVSDYISSVGNTVANYAAGVLSSTVGDAAASTATNLALNAAGPGVEGVATASSFTAGVATTEASALGITGAATDAAVQGAATAAAGAGAEIGSAAATAGANAVAASSEAATAAIGTATSVVASALPAIGAAISVVSDLVSGNYRGAAFVAAGAIIGTAILPGIGTAVGAVVGGLVDSLFPQHPKNPYANTEVNVVNGQIEPGKQVSQLESTASAADSITSFNDQLHTYLDKVGVLITNPDGKLGDLGNNLKGTQQNTSISDLFNRLTFGNNPNDTSNFGVAKGALDGLKFNDVTGLNDELLKIASFSDGLSSLGIKLASVGTNLTNISVASVSLTGALQDAADATSGAAPAAQAPLTPEATQLRIALSNDLPGQTFANTDALSAEIDKVNTFVNGTIPGLLDPILKSTSQLQTQVEATNQTYGAAITQAAKYGLQTQALIDAQSKADELILAAGRKQLDQADAAVSARYTIATTGPTIDTTLQAFDTQAQAQRDALDKSLTDVYGDSVRSTQYYGDQINNLEKTLGAERLKTAQDYAAQVSAALLGVGATVYSVRARQFALNGDQQDADLTNYDIKAAQETASYSKTLTDFYEAQYASTAEYQGYLTELETVQQGERAAIVAKYATQTTATVTQAATDQAAAAAKATQDLATAQGNISSLFTSLTDYAAKLQTGSSSPLSPTDQYAAALSQFQAVSGAAAAGDYKSASQLTGYSDTLLAASRAVNGSGTAYGADFNKVIDAVGAVSAVSDQLTASAQRDIQQQATDQVVAAVAALQAEVANLRREMQQQTRALAA